MRRRSRGACVRARVRRHVRAGARVHGGAAVNKGVCFRREGGAFAVPARRDVMRRRQSSVCLPFFAGDGLRSVSRMDEMDDGVAMCGGIGPGERECPLGPCGPACEGP